jgi:hypothetical protein
MKQFLEQAIPLTENQTDGILLTKNFLSIEETLRKNLLADDLNGQLALDQLRSQLFTIEARFQKGLEARSAPTSKKKTRVQMATAGGFAIAGFLMLIYLLGGRLIGVLKPAMRT